MDADPFQTARELHRIGRAAESKKICLDIIAKNPNDAEAINLLAVLTAEAGDINGGIELLRRVVALEPNRADGHNNLGALLKNAGRTAEAIESVQRALQISPNRPEIHYNIGNLLYQLGRFDEAVGAHQNSLRLNPNYAAAHTNLGLVFAEQGRLDEAIAECRLSIRLNPEIHHNYVNLLYSLYHRPGCGSAELLRETRQWSCRPGAPKPEVISRTGLPSGRKIRIGYLSPFFGMCADAHFILPLLANHDRDRFEIFCFTIASRDDDTTAQIRSHVDHWIDLRRHVPAQAAQVIRDQKLDILVNISRPADIGMSIAACRAAPIQMTWLTFSSCTTGLDTMDYRISDPHIDPPGHGPFFTEKTLQLPETAWCYAPLTDSPPVAQLPSLTSGSITFGSLNRFSKINTLLVGAWAEILRAVENSRLHILAFMGSHRQRLIDQFKALAIDPNRIEFIDRKPRLDYLAEYNRIDITLDTFPFSGHTTTLDSLWMGVPVVTLAGNTTVGRAAASALQNLKLPELIAHSSEEYVAAAVKLSEDSLALANLRATLRERMQSSPLMDAPKFARRMEQLNLNALQDRSNPAE